MNANALIASVIIPVFNKANFLDQCIEVLDQQSLDHSRFEALFINDGSTDNSLALLNNAAASRSWMRIISQENGGVVAARNTGIKAAQGRYLFFLDPDDSLSEDTLQRVSKFFDAHSNEVDLVTYKIIPLKNGQQQTLHSRYKILVASGMYDLQSGDNWMICQTTMNICVKNKFEHNVMFNFKTSNGVIYHEDQQYITEILEQKKKIGYCAGPKYLWNKNNASASNNIVNPYYIFDNTMHMFETLFSLDDSQPSQYIQYLFINDIAWKLRSTTPLPRHLHGKKYQKALQRFIALLNRVDDKVILKFPEMNAYHKYFLLNLKAAAPLEMTFGPNGIAVLRDGAFLFSREKMNVHVLRTRMVDNKLLLFGIVKSPFFLLREEKPKLYVEIQNRDGLNSVQLPLRDTAMSRIGTDELVARFFSFRYEIDLTTGSRVNFKVDFAHQRFDTFISLDEKRCNFSRPLDYTAYMGKAKVHVDTKSHAIFVTMARDHIIPLKSSLIKVRSLRKIIQREKIAIGKRHQAIWLYADAPQRLDNGWYQFVHDATKRDGVRRYYIAQGAQTPRFSSGKYAKIITANSKLHKALFLLADKILVSDISRDSYIPWDKSALLKYVDLINAQLIYLQHGVLWAHLPNYYAYDRVLFDKEVVSTNFEIENLSSNYGFLKSDLLPCGMPRYDYIDTTKQAKNKILLCPSWRQYLVGDLIEGKRQPLSEKFKNSDYFKRLANFLSSEKLHQLLTATGFTLEFKLHPNFSAYQAFFQPFESDAVKLVSGHIDEADYAVAITDYSSYFFDFVYLNRPIIYFIPDEELFFAGVNHYSQLDISLDDAFGEFVHDTDALVEALEKVLNNSCEPLSEYQQKYQKLFLYRDNNNRERIYQAVKNDA